MPNLLEKNYECSICQIEQKLNKGGFALIFYFGYNKKMIKKGNLYYPTKEFKKRAWLKDKKIYQEAEKNPVKFWEKLAKKLFWFKKWRKGFEHKPPYFKWFLGGKINITSNIFEHNLQGWKKIRDKPALIWEPEPIDEKPKTLTYQELFREVNKLSNALKKLGVKKGERIGIYLPMIPEVIISMLACARIGAVHTVVFSAFSPAALRIRLQIAEAKILITADGYYRRGKIVNLKEAADQGVTETKVEKMMAITRTPAVARETVFQDTPRTKVNHRLTELNAPKCVCGTDGTKASPSIHWVISLIRVFSALKTSIKNRNSSLQFGQQEIWSMTLAAFLLESSDRSRATILSGSGQALRGRGSWDWAWKKDLRVSKSILIVNPLSHKFIFYIGQRPIKQVPGLILAPAKGSRNFLNIEAEEVKPHHLAPRFHERG